MCLHIWYIRVCVYVCVYIYIYIYIYKILKFNMEWRRAQFSYFYDNVMMFGLLSRYLIFFELLILVKNYFKENWYFLFISVLVNIAFVVIFLNTPYTYIYIFMPGEIILAMVNVLIFEDIIRCLFIYIYIYIYIYTYTHSFSKSYIYIYINRI